MDYLIYFWVFFQSTLRDIVFYSEEIILKKMYLLLLLSSFIYFSHCSSQRRTSEHVWLPLQKLIISISSIRLSFTPHPAVHASLSLTRNLDHRLGFCKRGFTSFSSSPRGKQVLLFGEMRAW